MESCLAFAKQDCCGFARFDQISAGRIEAGWWQMLHSFLEYLLAAEVHPLSIVPARDCHHFLYLLQVRLISPYEGATSSATDSVVLQLVLLQRIQRVAVVVGLDATVPFLVLRECMTLQHSTRFKSFAIDSKRRSGAVHLEHLHPHSSQISS